MDTRHGESGLMETLIHVSPISLSSVVSATLLSSIHSNVYLTIFFLLYLLDDPWLVVSVKQKSFDLSMKVNLLKIQSFLLYIFISAIICIIPFTRTHLCGHLFLFTLCVIVTCTCKGVHARDCDWPGVPGAARPGQCPSCSHWLTERNILRCPDTRHSSGPGPGQEVRGDACRDPHASCYPTSSYDMTQLTHMTQLSHMTKLATHIHPMMHI